jgi:hypothetical protein
MRSRYGIGNLHSTPAAIQAITSRSEVNNKTVMSWITCCAALSAPHTRTMTEKRLHNCAALSATHTRTMTVKRLQAVQHYLRLTQDRKRPKELDQFRAPHLKGGTRIERVTPF